jgi:hypothetical protein
MQHVRGFDEYNEGFRDAMEWVGRKVNKVLGKIGSIFVDETDRRRALGEYEIEERRVDNYTYEFFHKNKMVARIFQPEGDEGDEMGRPVFKIYIYLYESEVPNTKNYKMRESDPDKEIRRRIERQSEKPYFKLQKRSFTISWLVQTFYEWWATKSKSGRSRTAAMNKGKQNTTPTKFYDQGVRSKGLFKRKFM